MATAENTVRQFDKHFKDMTECCICTETYKDPIILPCIHTFCMSCLQTAGFKSSKKPGDKMPCPVCRKEFTIPGDGFIGIQKNFFMTNLIELSKVFSRSSTACKCDACLQNSEPGSTTEVPLAENVCKDCCLKLCNDCSNLHGKNKLTKTHQLMSFESETSKEKLINDLTTEMCNKHVGERIKIYCRDCKDIVCAFCYIDSHQNHSWLEIDKAANKFRQHIQTNLDSLLSRSSETLEMKKQLEEAINEIVEITKFLEQGVIQRANEVKAVIDKHSKSLLAELEVIKQRRLEEIKKKIEKICEEKMNIDSYAHFCEEITSRGSSSVICQTVYDLITRSFHLKNAQECIIQRSLSPCNVGMDWTPLDAFLKDDGRNMIGRVLEMNAPEEELQYLPQNQDPVQQGHFDWTSDDTELDDETNKEELRGSVEAQHIASSTTNDTSCSAGNAIYSSSLNFIQKIRTRETDKINKGIIGVTILKNELYVLFRNIPSVEVYDFVQFRLIRGWNLDGLINSQDIASSSKDECLYIVDWMATEQTKSILRVDVNGNLIKKWSTGFDFGLLSVSPDSTVLMTAHKRSALLEYTSEGQLLREVKIKASACVHHMWQAIKLTSGHYLVSHGITNDHRTGVCQLNEHGDILKSYTSLVTMNTGRLLQPLHMAIRKDGLIIVADYQNNSVVLLSPDLEFVRQLTSDENWKFMGPSRMHLDHLNNLLFVADNVPGWKYGRVMVFNIETS